MASTIRPAEKLSPGHTIVMILSDRGLRYQSKLFDVAFLRSKNLSVPAWLLRGHNLPTLFV